MKIREYIKAQEESLPPELAKLLINEASVWSNDACYGYCIEAMEAAGYSEEKICDLLHYLHSAYEVMSVEEAEKRYQKW